MTVFDDAPRYIVLAIVLFVLGVTVACIVLGAITVDQYKLEERSAVAVQEKAAVAAATRQDKIEATQQLVAIGVSFAALLAFAIAAVAWLIAARYALCTVDENLDTVIAIIVAVRTPAYRLPKPSSLALPRPRQRLEIPAKTRVLDEYDPTQQYDDELFKTQLTALAEEKGYTP